MALFRKSENERYLDIDYKIDAVFSRRTALQWLVLTAVNKAISVERIDVDDFKSFHDGTISTQYTCIANPVEFVDAYECSSIVSVSIIGFFSGYRFVLSVSLDSGIIGLSFEKNTGFDYFNLERVLGLV